MNIKLLPIHQVIIGEQRIDDVCLRHSLAPATLRRAVSKCKGNPPSEWPGLLVDHRKGRSGRKPAAEVSKFNRFFSALTADYLRAECPTAKSCFDRCVRLAGNNGMVIPPLSACYAHLRAVPKAQKVAAREGGEALDALYPAQQRHVYDLSALEIVNADGWDLHTFVQLPPSPDGAPRGVGRPCLWVVQDVASRKILSAVLAETESADLVMRGMIDVVMNHGVPRRLVVDNTKAVSAGWLSGNRRRFGADDFAGVFGEAGIDIRRTRLIKTGGKSASGRAKNVGWGGGKPVERVFRDFSDRIAKHPALASFYTGNNVESKPYNYNAGRAGAAWELVERVIAEEVAAYNAQAARRGGARKQNESANDCFARLCESTPPVPATDDVLFALLSPAESTLVKRDATFTLRAGAATGFGSNRYHCDALLDYAGKRVLVRFDPTNLFAPVFVTDNKGKRIGVAHIQCAAGFADTESGREQNRAREAFKKATNKALAASARMRELELDAIAKANAPMPADDLPDDTAPPMPEIPRWKKTGTDDAAAASAGAQSKVLDAYNNFYKEEDF